MELAGSHTHALSREVEIHILRANGIAEGCLPEINDIEGRARIVAMFERALAADSCQAA
jgi:hypothetical protein